MLADDETRAIANMLEERCGLHFHSGNRDILDAGLARVAAAEGLSTAALGRLLIFPTDELLQRLIQAVTIGETYFFRHPEQFAALSDYMIPQLLRSGRKKLRAWSAGCATGEETYSLAIILSAYAPGTEIQVVGSDINQASLRIAERARYGRHSLRIASPLLDSNLHPVSGGEFEVAAPLRKLCSFRTLNLRDPNFPAQFAGADAFDIIFCRNVLVYFAPPLVTQIVARLRDCLSEGGYLCVSALDYTAQLPGLELVTIDGVPLLRRVPVAQRTPSSKLALQRQRPESQSPPTPPAAESIVEVMRAAKAAADQGQLDRAAAIAKDALTQQRSAEALHLLALILGELGQSGEMETLLLEAVQNDPDYVLGHLSLGLLDRQPQERWRSAQHLRTVIELLRLRRDEDVLQGPERLQVAMARGLAHAGLENLEKRP